MSAKRRTLAEPRPEEASVAPDPGMEPNRRLVVELTRASAADLARFVSEEDVNKTTIVNRALAVYRTIRAAEKEGGKVLIRDSSGEMLRLVLI